MGLAASNYRLLTITRRLADIQLRETLLTNRKLQLASEMSKLSQEYSNRLSQKDVAFYANGQYNKINYSYLMGYGGNYFTAFNGSKPLKENNSMILTDYNGRVVLSDTYANAIMSVLGTSAMNAYGQGGTFSEDEIPNILAALCPPITAEEFQNGVESHSWRASTINALTGDTTGSTTVDTADTYNARIQSIIDLYYPIFQSAAANGWTTEYNQQMNSNDDYVSDALNSGIFQLAQIDEYGTYMPDTSITYFVTSGDIELRSDSDTREKITAWYNDEQNRIKEKEQMYDVEITDLSTQENAYKTEMEAVKKFIQDSMKVFEWCSNA